MLQYRKNNFIKDNIDIFTKRNSNRPNKKVSPKQRRDAGMNRSWLIVSTNM